MKKSIIVTLIATAFISTHTTYSMLAKRTAFSAATALRASTIPLHTTTATRIMLAQAPKPTIVRTISDNATKKNKAGIDAIISLLPTEANVDGNYGYQIKQLLTPQPDVNAYDEHGNTALLIAAKNNLIPAVQALLAHGAYVNHVNHGGETALMKAAQKGNTQVVKMLLGRGASQDKTNPFNYTALMYAVASNHPETVKLLLARLANCSSVEHTDKWGFTPLQIAVIFGHTETVVELLNFGHHSIANKNRALAFATWYDRTEIAKRLRTIEASFTPSCIIEHL